MRLKKILIAAAAVALTSLPLIANADLFITNNTAHDSAVKILGKCTGPSSAGVTPAGAQNKPYSQVIVKLLCNEASTCTAEIYDSPDCSTGDFGSATIDTNSDNITSVNTPGHSVTYSGNHVAINN